MIRKLILATPYGLNRHPGSTVLYPRRLFSGHSESSNTRVSELPRIDSLVEGFDYNHWLVLMQPPENYPNREEIVQQYVTTLAMALGSEKAAKESIYSVSTKYYYAFSCKASENVTHKIKSLPRVKFVLPDSYLCPGESCYGGEPYNDGNVAPYEEKYHAQWLNEVHEDQYKDGTNLRKPRRKKRGSRNPRETSDRTCGPIVITISGTGLSTPSMFCEHGHKKRRHPLLRTLTAHA